MDAIRGPVELYAHAIAIETEAAQRYAELAQRMADEGRAELASVFHWLASEEADHLETLRSRTEGVALPQVDARGYGWLDHSRPETASRELVFRLMTPRIALAIALHAERRAQAFFEQVSWTADDPALRLLAREMEDEERRHAALIATLLESTPAASADQTVLFAR